MNVGSVQLDWQSVLSLALGGGLFRSGADSLTLIARRSRDGESEHGHTPGNPPDCSTG